VVGETAVAKPAPQATFSRVPDWESSLQHLEVVLDSSPVFTNNPSNSMNPPRRVALISHSSALSGGEQALLRAVRALGGSGYLPHVVLPGPGPLRQVLESLGVPVAELATAWWIPATHWSAEVFRAQLVGLEQRTEALGRWLAAERIDLVHTNTVVTLEGALAAAGRRLPHVWHSRGLFDGGFPPSFFGELRGIFETITALADVMPCVSRAVADQARCHEPDSPCRLVPDGFDLGEPGSRPPAPRAEVAARLGVPINRRLVVSLGGIQRRKGLLDLVDAAGKLARQFSDVVFILGGSDNDPTHTQELRGRIAALGLEARVLLPGQIADPASLLSHAELFVHPSHSEGFGLAILEAMALARPVIATRCGGPEDLIESGRSGLLVDVGNADQLAEAIRVLLGDPVRAARMGEEAGRQARRFDLQTLGDNLDRAYSEACERHASRGRLGRGQRLWIASEVLGSALGRAASPPGAASGAPLVRSPFGSALLTMSRVACARRPRPGSGG